MSKKPAPAECSIWNAPTDLSPAIASEILGGLFRAAGDQRKSDAERKDLDDRRARCERTVSESMEMKDLEEAREKRDAVRKRLLDNDEYRSADADVKAKSKALRTIEPAREERRLAKEIKAIDDATMERRRAIIAEMFKHVGSGQAAAPAQPAMGAEATKELLDIARRDGLAAAVEATSGPAESGRDGRG